MTQEEIKDLLKFIICKCDLVINNENYTADEYAQNKIEDIAEMCHRVLDGQFGETIETSKSSIPANLDEAAEKFAHFYDNGTCDGVAQECFKAGAEWMAGQGQTFETIMQEDDVDELVPTCPDMYNHGYSYGDKVIVQIRKKS